MDLVNDPVNPLTNEDLESLIKKRPHVYGRFSGLVGKLGKGAIMTEEQVKKVKRRIVDYLHKYATIEQLLKIAAMLGVKVED